MVLDCSVPDSFTSPTLPHLCKMATDLGTSSKEEEMAEAGIARQDAEIGFSSNITT